MDLFFYSHHHRHGYLSNFYCAPFREDSLVFDTVERYMHYHKALLFRDDSNAHKIMEAQTPAACKKLGAMVLGFDQHLWDVNKQRIVERGVRLKFEAHPELRLKLIGTGTRRLLEASPHDRVWGIGCSETSARAVNESRWGQNLLGQILVKVRGRLIEEFLVV